MKLRGARILVVDDTPDVLDVFATLLRLEGARVATADSGGEALRTAQQERFDAILTDLDLPDLAGEEVIRRLRGTPYRPSKVAAVTAAGEPALTRARQAGADEVFLKPVDVEAIVQFAAGALQPCDSAPGGAWRATNACVSGGAAGRPGTAV